MSGSQRVKVGSVVQCFNRQTRLWEPQYEWGARAWTYALPTIVRVDHATLTFYVQDRGHVCGPYNVRSPCLGAPPPNEKEAHWIRTIGLASLKRSPSKPALKSCTADFSFDVNVSTPEMQRSSYAQDEAYKRAARHAAEAVEAEAEAATTAEKVRGSAPVSLNPRSLATSGPLQAALSNRATVDTTLDTTLDTTVAHNHGRENDTYSDAHSHRSHHNSRSHNSYAGNTGYNNHSGKSSRSSRAINTHVSCKTGQTVGKSVRVPSQRRKSVCSRPQACVQACVQAGSSTIHRRTNGGMHGGTNAVQPPFQHNIVGKGPHAHARHLMPSAPMVRPSPVLRH